MSTIRGHSPSPTVVSRFTECLDEYRLLKFALGEDNCIAVQLGHIKDPERIHVEYKRLLAWGQQSKILHTSSAGLDDILQHDIELKTRLIATLSRLKDRLSEGKPVSLNCC